ncbi:MAG: DinB family protein [Chloroflexi bacterium]|nr:DinB family protein [Chloroflexota bacterium]
MSSTLGSQLAVMTRELLEQLASSLDDLSPEELHALPLEFSTSIGFNAWHVMRSADNILHFVFYREQPIWAQQGLAEAWGLPRNEQGTGMPLADVQALRFPGPAELAQYGRDAASSIVARIETMDEAFLLGTTPGRLEGEVAERQRAHTLGRVIVSHGNQHYGFIQLLRQMLGKDEPGT